MCEGNAPTASDTVSQPLTPRRHRRSRGIDHHHVSSGWDVPPPVASPIQGQWKPRECRWRTPQRIATLQHENSTTCNPIIVLQKYVLVASNVGELLLFGNFHLATKPWNASTPLCSLSLESDSTIVTMEASNDSNIIARNNNNNNIFVLSVEGQVHEISIHEASSPDDDDHNAQPSLKLEGSWNTGICGATCLKVLGSMNQLVIGYDSGYLEAWKIRKRNKSEPVLIWRGILDFHIRSVAPLRRRAAGDSNENNTGSEVAPPKKEKNTNKEQETNEYFLLVTLQSEAGNDRHATASLVEILDLATIQEAYLDSKRLTIPLYGHLRFPAPGMELVDSSTLPSDDTGRLPKRVQVLPSRGSDRAMVLGGEENSMCGVALSDGTVALVSPYLDSWGVAQDRHQLLLSYPAIGCGRVFVDEDHHFVCCLRGGTCFLIPTRADSQKHVTVISYPHDVDADTTSAYVQGFTAGTLLMDEKSSLPVLIYAWAGGAVDVYACHLVHPTQEETLDSQLTQMNWKEPDASEHKLLEEMMNNESLSIVLTLFDDMEKDQNHKLLQEENWEMAQKEFKLSEFTSPVTLKQLCSDKLESLRFLLLALASQ